MDYYQKLLKEQEKTDLILECANYCIQYNWSIRQIAKNVGMSKSTVYRYLTKNLRYIDADLYVQCQNKLINKR